MKYSKWLCFSLLAVVALSGCARAARDTSGFASIDSTTVNASLEETWQATKSVMREMDLDIYTRDKRGAFLAYTQMQRRFHILTPQRSRLSITLEEQRGGTVKITAETLRQVYGVTLLTYPDWHDRQTTDNQEALTILDAVKAKLS